MKDVVVHQQQMGDVEDFEIYHNYILEWFYQTDKGIWCTDHNIQLKYLVHDSFDYYHTFQLIGEMPSKDAFVYKLAFGD